MKKNQIFRSAKLSNLNDDDLDILEKNKIFKIIDLRDPVEIDKAPDNLSSNLLKKYILQKPFRNYSTSIFLIHSIFSHLYLEKLF